MVSPGCLLALLVEGDMQLLAAWSSVSSEDPAGSLAVGPSHPSIAKSQLCHRTQGLNAEAQIPETLGSHHPVPSEVGKSPVGTACFISMS